MSSSDVRDMLNLPSASSASRPPRKQKSAAPRPKITGLARELQMLGGDTPIAIIQDHAPRGRKRAAIGSNTPATPWVLQPFTNPAREDGLVLKHWQQKQQHRPTANAESEGEKVAEQVDTVQQLGESTFAKYNIQVEKLKYSDAEYDSLLRSDEWSREETDYLVDLVAEYEQRWPVVWDRYEYTPAAPSEEHSEGNSGSATKLRDMEDLKARYYDISAKIMAHNRPVHSMDEAEYKLHEAYLAFDPVAERRRKEYAENLFQRTKEETKEEENLVAELKRLTARSERLNEEHSELYARLDAPTTPSNANIAQFTQSAALQHLVSQLLTTDKNRKRKSLMPGEVMSPSVNGQLPNGLDRRDSSRQDSMSGAGGAGKKAGLGSERRKLTEEEEHIFGVTHHDRLTHGSMVRSDKATKAIQGKSGTHATKVLTILSELELPVRINMPTQNVITEFELLISKINTLLDAKKLSDKLDAEILLARKQKAEREERERQAQREKELGGGEDTVMHDREPEG